MDKDLHIDQHISHSFNEELETRRSRVLAMGGLGEQQCGDALTALLDGDNALAQRVAIRR
jgi:phosphate transport system protein